jgi:RNA polymerase sporulation-specific sigma factor
MPRLKWPEIQALFARLHAGDKSTRKELINGNLRLVLKVIHSFRNRSTDADDLFQIGTIGLIKAIDNFDPTFNIKFSTYAVPMIQGEILHYLQDNNPIHVNRDYQRMAYKAINAKEHLRGALAREPTTEEIAQYLEVDHRDLEQALAAAAPTISLFDPIYDNDKGEQLCVIDQAKDDHETEDNWLTAIAIKEGISRLKWRERRIMFLRYYLGKHQEEVADIMGLTQSSVSRTEKAALEKIRHQQFPEEQFLERRVRKKRQKKGSEINQYDLSGTLIRTWPSSQAAGKALNLHVSGLYQCCHGKTKTCGGFKWEWQE